MPQRIYQFHVLLENTKPRIWRRILVLENYTMWDLHIAIQDSMGWDDCHLHEFTSMERRPKKEINIGIPDDTGWTEILPGWKESIKKWFNLESKKVMRYIYDFGDNWEHRITLEKILSKQKDTSYPVCIAGKNAYPLEDSGGIWGYYEESQA